MYYVIVNPLARSGKGRQIWEDISPIFKELNKEYKAYIVDDISKRGEIISEIEKDSAKKKHIIVLAGDGGFNQFLQAMPSFAGYTFSVIPAGSSNDLARDLGINKNADIALRDILNEKHRALVDLGVVHCKNSKALGEEKAEFERKFLVSTGLGYDAAICVESEQSSLKRKLNKIGLGKLIYVAIALISLARTPYNTGSLKLDNRNEEMKLSQFLFASGMNHKYEGGGVMFGPKAKNNDGELDICVVDKVAKFKVPFILPLAYSGKIFGFKGVDSYRTPGYTIDLEKPMWVHTDGEIDSPADHIEVKVLKEAMELVY